MNPELSSLQVQFKDPIPARSKYRLSIFVWVSWQWHKEMRENKLNVKNRLEFKSWDFPHSLPRRIAIALRDREANPSDIGNYKDPFKRLGDRYRAYWRDHLEIQNKVFSNNEPDLQTPEDYVKPTFSFKNSFPTYENTKTVSSFNSSDPNIENDSDQNNTCNEHSRTERSDSSAKHSTHVTVNERPKPPSSYIESPELVALLNYIHSRDHAVALGMIIDFVKYGNLQKSQNDRKRLHEILIRAGFSSEFISLHDSYMEYYIHNLKFIYAEMWKTVSSLINVNHRAMVNVNDIILAESFPHQNINANTNFSSISQNRSSESTADNNLRNSDSSTSSKSKYTIFKLFF